MFIINNNIMNNNVMNNKNMSDKYILLDKLYYNYRKRISNENKLNSINCLSTKFILLPIISNTFYDIFNINTITNKTINIFQQKSQ